MMKKAGFLFFFLVPSISAQEILDLSKINRFSIAFRMGYSPNQFGELTQGETDESDTNDRIATRIKEINQFYTNGSNYAGSPIVRDFRFNNDANNAFTVGVDFRYFWKDLLFQIGFTYFIINSTYKSYYSVLGELSSRSSDPNHKAYDDIDENYDRDNDFVEEALGLFPTDGREYFFSETTTAKRFDIPISIAIHLSLLEKYHLFMGVGLSYHYGKVARVIDAVPTTKGDRFTPDIDIFEARTIGVFVFLTAEYHYNKHIGFFSSVQIDYGTSPLVADQKITGKGTVNSLFHLNDENDPGGPEKNVSESPRTGMGFKRYALLNFSGFQAHFGVSYFLTAFK